MADWDTTDSSTLPANGRHSRQSSHGSEYSSSSKENTSDNPGDDISHRTLILREGNDLKGESRTEIVHSGIFESNNLSVPGIQIRQAVTQGPGFGTAKAKAARSPYTAPPVELIPVEAITIPNDANISSFTSVQLANFLRCLNIEDRIISHLHRKSVDGRRFSKMTETEMDTLGMNNPVVTFFRNKSAVKGKKKGPFML